MASVHHPHASHAETLAHTGIKNHCFEFAVGTETDENGNKVVGGQQAYNCLGEDYSARGLAELLTECARLHPETENAKIGEEVD